MRGMGRFAILAAAAVAATFAEASWYWPFGGGSGDDSVPRISQLMEPASKLLYEAADAAEEGRIHDAIGKYRQVLDELRRLEIENPERAATAEFSTVRNKRAYVEAAIDSLFLEEARKNAKAVVVTDTTALEKRLAQEKEDLAAGAARRVAPPQPQAVETEAPQAATNQVAQAQTASATVSKPAAPAGSSTVALKEMLEKDPKNRKARLLLAAADLKAKDFAAAKLAVAALLEEKPNDAAALNLRAAVESAEGDLDAAEKTLVQAIQSNPKSHFAYYNLAHLVLRRRGDSGKEAARRYYENGREYCGGPRDAALEDALK